MPAGDTPVDRLVAVIRRITKASARQPRPIRRAGDRDHCARSGRVGKCQAEVQRIVAAVLSVPLVGIDPELREGTVRILAHVWFASLLGWVNGWMSGVGQVGDELEFAARLLLRGE